MKKLLLITLIFLSLLPLTLAQTYFKQCTYIWDSSSYVNQDVNIIASASDSIGAKDSDSVTINVVNYETGVGGAARPFDENLLDIQITQPRGDVGSGAVEIKMSAQGPNEIGDFSVSIRSGQGGVAFPISNRNCASGGVSGAGGSGIPASTGDSGSSGEGVIKSIPGSGSGGSNSTPLVCDGCILGNKCVFVGYRANEKYCELSGEFKEQEEADSSCENSFECSSNLCIDDRCVEKGLFRRILEFFRRLFGTE